MLGKLLKHDIIAISRYFIPTFLAFVVISIINKITFEIGFISNTENQFMEISSIILMTLYILCIVAVYILIYVFITMHFYQTMSGEQGYLTHTLPVKSITIINSKLLCAILWQFVGGILITASFLLLAAGHISNIEFKILINEIIEIYTHMSGSLKNFILLLIASIILGWIYSPLMFYVSIAFGHLFKKQRLVGSVIAFITIYIIQNIASAILLTTSGYWRIVKQAIDSNVFYDTYNTTMLNNLLLSIVFTIIFYVITNWIFSKKLNLE